MPLRDDFINMVTEHYLKSKDFNGIPVRTVRETLKLSDVNCRELIRELIQDDVISVVYGDVHPNPFIKALREEEKDKQIGKLNQLQENTCIYPAPAHLKRTVNPADYAGRPFDLKLALGEAQLSFYSFDLSVLEIYHNDPRYSYESDDISGTICYKDEGMKEADRILLESFGFSFGPNLERAVAVFLRYLSRLSAEHQQIWNAKLIDEKYLLHPDYYRSSILGEWPEKVSVFDAFVEELHHINAMCGRIGWPPLFNDDYWEGKKPKEFCFMLRPTSKKYNEFVEMLDKMLSQNLNVDFFRNEVPIEYEETRRDGKVSVGLKGTIRLLDEFLKNKFITRERKDIEEMIEMFKEVRRLRRGSAHRINEDAYDPEFYSKQRNLIIKAYAGVRLIRLLLANHPAVKGYGVPDWLFYEKIWTR
jgi:hypothetical protein